MELRGVKKASFICVYDGCPWCPCSRVRVHLAWKRNWGWKVVLRSKKEPKIGLRQGKSSLLPTRLTFLDWFLLGTYLSWWYGTGCSARFVCVTCFCLGFGIVFLDLCVVLSKVHRRVDWTTRTKAELAVPDAQGSARVGFPHKCVIDFLFPFAFRRKRLCCETKIRSTFFGALSFE